MGEQTCRVDGGGASFDPAALLIATFVLVGGSLTRPGEWTVSNSVICVIVGFVLVAYFIGDGPGEDLKSRWRRAALSLVLGLTLSLALAWPVIQPLVRVAGVHDPDRVGEIATYICYLGSVPIAMLLFKLLKPRTRVSGAEGGP